MTQPVGFLPGTECLTKDGWVAVESLADGIDVWVVDPKTGNGKFERSTRKKEIPYNGPVHLFESGISKLEVVDGQRMLFAGKKRPIYRKAGGKVPRTPHIYTTSTRSTTSNVPETTLSKILAVIRYGIVDETGYSVRIDDPAHRREFARLLGRRGAEKGVWEKWGSVISSPALRGFNVDLSLMGGNQARVLGELYNYWGLYNFNLTPQQLNQFQSFFSTSDVQSVVAVSNRLYVLGPSRTTFIDSYLVTDEQSTLTGIYVASKYLLVRRGGACWVVGDSSV